MTTSLQDTRKGNLAKATEIRRLGYKSSIHALPSEVKTRLDELLSQRLSPAVVLNALCEQFPNIKFPSAKAIENYRSKYHKQTLTRTRAMRKNEMALDIKKQEIETVLTQTSEVMIRKILPKLIHRLENALEKEKQIGIPLRMTDNALKSVVTVISALSGVVNKNDLRTIATSPQITEKPLQDKSDEPVDWDNFFDMLNNLPTKRKQIVSSS